MFMLWITDKDKRKRGQVGAGYQFNTLEACLVYSRQYKPLNNKTLNFSITKEDKPLVLAKEFSTIFQRFIETKV